MKNPWTKKNPFMSMWLSGANTIANQVRGQSAAAVKREANAIAARGFGDVLDFWSKAMGAATRGHGATKPAAKSAARKRSSSGTRTRRSSSSR